MMVADLVDVNTLPRIAHEFSRCTGGFWTPAQALEFISAVLTVCITITYIRRWNTHSILAGELLTGAGAVHAADLITAVPTVIHTVTAEEEIQMHKIDFRYRF